MTTPITTGLLLGVEDTGHVTVEHRLTNLLFLLFSSFFCPFVPYCFTSTLSSTPSRSQRLGERASSRRSAIFPYCTCLLEGYSHISSELRVFKGKLKITNANFMTFTRIYSMLYARFQHANETFLTTFLFFDQEKCNCIISEQKKSQGYFSYYVV